MNVLSESTEFTTAQTGWQQFFTKAAPTYSVQFNPNDGTGTMSAVQVAQGEYTLPECAFTAPDGKVFAGWSYEQNGEAITTDSITVNKALTLYAVWADKAGVKDAVEIPATGTNEAPATGDTSNYSLWVILTLASGICLICIVAYRRKQKENRQYQHCPAAIRRRAV